MYVFPKLPRLDQTSQCKVLHETQEVTEMMEVSKRAASRQEEVLAQKEMSRVVCHETGLHNTLLGRCWHRKNKKDHRDIPKGAMKEEGQHGKHRG